MNRSIPSVLLLLCLVALLPFAGAISGQESATANSSHTKSAALPEATKEKLRLKMQSGAATIEESISLLEEQWRLANAILDRRYKQAEMSLADYGDAKIRLLDDASSTKQALYDAEIAYVKAFEPYLGGGDHY